MQYDGRPKCWRCVLILPLYLCFVDCAFALPSIKWFAYFFVWFFIGFRLVFRWRYPDASVMAGPADRGGGKGLGAFKPWLNSGLRNFPQAESAVPDNANRRKGRMKIRGGGGFGNYSTIYQFHLFRIPVLWIIIPSRTPIIYFFNNIFIVYRF